MKPLITTGRLSTRMTAADKTRLESRLKPFLATPEYLASPPQPLEVELGIGNGLAMLARAKANPGWHYLGSEIYLNGLRTLVTQLEKEPQLVTDNRLLITDSDARELLKALPAQSVERLLILFPDPWPKAKHHKRRLVQPELLTEAARVLKPGAELWVVSDWPAYAYHAIATLHAHKAFVLNGTDNPAARCKTKPAKPIAKGEPIAQRPLPIAPLSPAMLATVPAWWAPTAYQTKAAAQNRHPWFILAHRV